MAIIHIILHYVVISMYINIFHYTKAAGIAVRGWSSTVKFMNKIKYVEVFLSTEGLS